MWKVLLVAGPTSGVLYLAVAGGQPSGGTVPVALISSAITGLGIILSGKIVVPTFAYNREKDRADRLETELLRVNGALADKHVPALDAAAAAVSESTSVIREALAVLARRKT